MSRLRPPETHEGMPKKMASNEKVFEDEPCRINGGKARHPGYDRIDVWATDASLEGEGR